MSELDLHNPQAILNATFPDPGMSARLDGHTGRVVLKLPNGNEVSWAGAVRAGPRWSPLRQEGLTAMAIDEYGLQPRDPRPSTALKFEEARQRAY